MIRNGLQMLGLLNSAGYARAEMPLDESCSLIAPNNTGKTSLIAALQYVLIADGKRMNFGEHTREASRKFYFPTNASYVLAQIQQADGVVVIGAVGKGHAHDYEYFAYKGALDLDDFRAEDGSLVTQPQLKAHMAARGRVVYTYSPGEFSDGLYGRNRKRQDHEPNFNLFRLEHVSHAGVFQAVLARTLKLDRLNSSDVKRFLLEIFKHELTDSSIDFQAAWDRAFEQVNRDRAQYEAARHQQEHVLGLGKDLASLLSLRGKLLAHRPIIDDLLRQWASNYKTDKVALTMEHENLRTQLATLSETHGDLRLSRERTSNAKAKIEVEQARQSELAATFALISERKTLEAALAAIIDERDKLVTRIGNAKERSLDALRREIDAASKERRGLEAALASLNDNLYLALINALGQDNAMALARTAHPGVLSLPPGAFSLDAPVLKAAAAVALDGAKVRLSGLSIDTSTLPDAPLVATQEALAVDLETVDARLSRLNADLETASELEEALRSREVLEDQIREAEQNLDAFDEYQRLLAKQEERAQRLQVLLADLVEFDRLLDENANKEQTLRDDETDNITKQQALESDNKQIERLRGERRDTGPAFDDLAYLPRNDWVQAINIPLRDLPSALDDYIRDCSDMVAMTITLRRGIADAHAAGLTKFVGAAESGMEAEIQHMVNFIDALPHEEEALERAAKKAVVDVSSALVGLRRSLEEMHLKMRDFNKVINQRKLSDLDVFKLELVELHELVEAIDKLLSTAQRAGEGESFALFNQKDILGDDAIDRAKGTLIREGQQNNGLRLENLFRLEFKVAKQGQAVEAFEELEESASLGTILMAKLVIGLAMLHLMRDKRSASQAVCYLDEAANLDPVNQRSLIDIAREFGFSLIFASPLPQTTAHYCVPIDAIGGRNQIVRQRWQLIETISAESSQA